MFEPEHGWNWLEHNDIVDCVCGISYGGKPIGVGVFFDLNLVLTSATAVEPYLKDLKGLRVHSIFGAYDLNMPWNVTCVTTSYRFERKNYWHPLGYDNKHSGIHDLTVLFADSTIDYDLAPEAVNTSNRHAFSMYLATRQHRILSKGFIFAGFGFIDEEHVTRMNELEIEIYDEAVLVDCDDYIPRDWGRFICIANLRNDTGVQSGSPLLQRNLIYGIGSFALEKGEDKILVFTDVREYVSHLYYCEKPGINILWTSRYWSPAMQESIRT